MGICHSCASMESLFTRAICSSVSLHFTARAAVDRRCISWSNSSRSCSFSGNVLELVRSSSPPFAHSRMGRDSIMVTEATKRCTLAPSYSAFRSQISLLMIVLK